MRPRLAVALTFPAYPPLGGGQVRVYNLYRALAKTFDIELVTLGPEDAPARRTRLAPGLWETCVPKSAEHSARERELEREVGTVVTDVAMCRLFALTEDYLAALREAACGVTAVVASHPYTVAAIRQVTDAPLCYEAQDVEAILKADVLGSSEAGRALLSDVAAAERRCCQEAALVWACSSEDRDELVRRYGAPIDRVLVVPNGADLGDLRYTPPRARRELRRRLRMQERFLVVFIASWHQPNVMAARSLLELARRLPEVDFVILGSVGMALQGRRLSDNVQLTGVVSAEFKLAVLCVADAALNPVTTGSGTNIKMLDYFSCGVPVISSAFGARGLNVRAGEHYVQAEPADQGAALIAMRDSGSEALEPMVEAARAHVEATLSWPSIADGLLEGLRRTFALESVGGARRVAASARFAPNGR